MRNLPHEPTFGDFNVIRRLAHQTIGLDLRAGKEQLVSARLGKLLRDLRIDSLQKYCDYVVNDSSGAAIENMIDALTTNFTSFFREQVHFEFLRKKVIPAYSNKGEIRCWSAACSTGEEPFTLAITLRESGRSAGAATILATDVSHRVLEAARKGVFHVSKTNDIPKELLRKYFFRGQGEANCWCRVKPEILEMVRFSHLNLIEPFGAVGEFDVIFCRNVLIYFDRATQIDVATRLAGRLRPGGYLFIGHAESLTGMDSHLRFVSPSVYQRVK